MGICASMESDSEWTAKLIHIDGRLQEFRFPVKVSFIHEADPSSFVCNADDMEFDGVADAVRDDEELELGKLYFALPRSKLRRTISPEEMAALAVKASNAMMKSEVKGRGRRKGVVRVSTAKIVDGGGDEGKTTGRRRKRSGSNLSAIMEE